MYVLRPFVCIAVAALVSACGGSPPGPQSERNAYGHPVAEMQGAPASLATTGGTVALKAWGNASTRLEPGTPKWTVDPITGRVEFEPGTGAVYPVWFVAVALTDTAGEMVVATDWTVTTVWVLQGSEFVSTRTLYSEDSKLFVVEYPNPPFSSNGTQAVVELTRSGATQLVSAAILWPSE